MQQKLTKEAQEHEKQELEREKEKMEMEEMREGLQEETVRLQAKTELLELHEEFHNVHATEKDYKNYQETPIDPNVHLQQPTGASQSCCGQFPLQCFYCTLYLFPILQSLSLSLSLSLLFVCRHLAI